MNGGRDGVGVRKVGVGWGGGNRGVVGGGYGVGEGGGRGKRG